MDMLTWFSGLATLWQALIILLVVVWIAICYFLSGYAERKWGDRETGAVLGFFVPMLLLMIWVGH